MGQRSHVVIHRRTLKEICRLLNVGPSLVRSIHITSTQVEIVTYAGAARKHEEVSAQGVLTVSVIYPIEV